MTSSDAVEFLAGKLNEAMREAADKVGKAHVKTCWAAKLKQPNRDKNAQLPYFSYPAMCHTNRVRDLVSDYTTIVGLISVAEKSRGRKRQQLTTTAQIRINTFIKTIEKLKKDEFDWDEIRTTREDLYG